MEKFQCMAHGFDWREDCTDCHYCKVSNGNIESISTKPAFKDDAAKPDMTLITYDMVAPAAKILKFGEKKYGRLNYRNPNPGFEGRLIAATLRHLLQHNSGEELDPESGETHLSHALASLMLIFDRRAHKKEGEVL